jgi:hypothetical protein
VLGRYDDARPKGELVVDPAENDAPPIESGSAILPS